MTDIPPINEQHLPSIARRKLKVGARLTMLALPEGCMVAKFSLDGVRTRLVAGEREPRAETCTIEFVGGNTEHLIPRRMRAQYLPVGAKVPWHRGGILEAIALEPGDEPGDLDLVLLEASGGPQTRLDWRISKLPDYGGAVILELPGSAEINLSCPVRLTKHGLNLCWRGAAQWKPRPRLIHIVRKDSKNAAEQTIRAREAEHAGLVVALTTHDERFDLWVDSRFLMQDGTKAVQKLRAKKAKRDLKRLEE